MNLSKSFIFNVFFNPTYKSKSGLLNLHTILPWWWVFETGITTYESKVNEAASGEHFCTLTGDWVMVVLPATV